MAKTALGFSTVGLLLAAATLVLLPSGSVGYQPVVAFFVFVPCQGLGALRFRTGLGKAAVGLSLFLLVVPFLAAVWWFVGG